MEHGKVFTSGVLIAGFFMFLPAFLLLKAESPAAQLKELRKKMVEERQGIKKEAQELKKKIQGVRPMHLIGAKVAVNEGSSLTVAATDGKTYIINTDSNTKVRRHFWGASSLSEILVGHTVNIWGKFTDDAKTTVLATLIRDLSIAKRKGVFMGKITTLRSDGFDMETVNKGMQSVTVASSTKYINRRGETIALSDLKVGHRVRVGGVWDQTTKKINEVTEIKDFSLPIVVKPSVSPITTQ